MLTIDQIRAVVADFFKDKPVKQVWLFGSYARGEATEESDVDLLVSLDESKARMSLLTFLGYADRLEEVLQRKVDLVHEPALYPLIRQYSRKDWKELFSA